MDAKKQEIYTGFREITRDVRASQRIIERITDAYGSRSPDFLRKFHTEFNTACQFAEIIVAHPDSTLFAPDAKIWNKTHPNVTGEQFAEAVKLAYTAKYLGATVESVHIWEKQNSEYDFDLLQYDDAQSSDLTSKSVEKSQTMIETIIEHSPFSEDTKKRYIPLIKHLIALNPWQNKNKNFEPFSNFVGIVNDAAQREIQRETLSARSLAEKEYMAAHDPLTGLLNRLYLEEILSYQHIERRKKHHPGVIFIDMEKFKSINDTLSHEGGDKYLILAARILKSVTRPTDIVIRYGGDEFLIILDDVNEEEIVTMVKRLKAAVIATNNNLNLKIPLSLTIGYSSQQTPEETLGQIIHKADQAMYLNK